MNKHEGLAGKAEAGRRENPRQRQRQGKHWVIVIPALKCQLTSLPCWAITLLSLPLETPENFHNE